ncbi:hypothetical protein [Streptomyces sp. WM6372]|uniref:hypothetical protein n=1 Tax=Streptomyces sp. WM6372 TaxID=1415555 RepID=UPI000A452721|nr:hypothetical protein [Streptomyces sp. WM6372]
MSLLATILVIVGLWCAASVALASCFSAYRIWCRSDRRRRGAPGRLGAETGRS